jgi:hypothetical protein
MAGYCTRDGFLVIELIQDKGYKASDIGIIVRDGKEGSRVLDAP